MEKLLPMTPQNQQKGDIMLMEETQQQDNTPAEKIPAYRRLQAVIEVALIVVGLLAMTFLLNHGVYGDGKKRFLAVSALLTQGQFKDGPYSQYSMIGPFFSIPFWYLGKWFSTPIQMISQYNQFVFACGLLAIYLLLKDRMDRHLLRKFLIILLAASMFSMNVTAYYGEVFTAICVGAGVLALLISPTSLTGWGAIILGVANTPATMAGLILLVGKRLLDSKRLRYILAIVVAGGLITMESWIRRGSPFANGYEHDTGIHTIMPYSGLVGFSYPFFFGLLSILLSFGKGIFFFAPGLLLPVRKTLLKIQQKEKLDLYRGYLLWICFLVGLVLIYSRWWSWFGGLYWGPRFFLIASIPASFALAVRIHDKDHTSLLVNLLTLVVLCLSFWVGLDGAVYSAKATAIPLCMVNSGQLELLCHYTPDFSALWYPFVQPQQLDRSRALYVVYWTFAFAYLLLPLLIKIIEQIIAWLKTFNATYLNIREWNI
jgi:hypothetical protein